MLYATCFAVFFCHACMHLQSHQHYVCCLDTRQAAHRFSVFCHFAGDDGFGEIRGSFLFDRLFEPLDAVVDSCFNSSLIAQVSILILRSLARITTGATTAIALGSER